MNTPHRIIKKKEPLKGLLAKINLGGFMKKL